MFKPSLHGNKPVPGSGTYMYMLILHIATADTNTLIVKICNEIVQKTVCNLINIICDPSIDWMHAWAQPSKKRDADLIDIQETGKGHRNTLK